jgi:hypothetical protein
MGLVLFVFDTVFYAVGHATARMLLPLLTAGKVKVDGLLHAETGFNWFGFKRLQDGVLLCDSLVAGWLGLAVWTFGLVAILALV